MVVNRHFAIAAAGLCLAAGAARCELLDLPDGLAWQALNPGDDVRFEITNGSPVVTIDGAECAAAAFEVSGTEELKLDLSSYAGDLILCPSVMFVGAEGRVLKVFPSKLFAYRPAQMLEKDRLFGKLKVLPPEGATSVRMLVYASVADLSGSTQMMNPAEVYAAARSNGSTGVKGRVVSHSAYGSLRLKVKSGGGVRLGADPAPEIVASPAADVESDHGEVRSADTVLAESREFYLSSIRKAVAGNDVGRALRLLEEAERLGVDGARDVFVSSLQSSRGTGADETLKKQ